MTKDTSHLLEEIKALRVQIRRLEKEVADRDETIKYWREQNYRVWNNLKAKD